MRKAFFSLLIAASLTACGGSGGSAGLDGNSVSGNFISTTVEVERRFLYSLNREEGSVSGFLVVSEEEGAHDHAHGQVLAQHDHEHSGEASGEGLELQELDSSPYTFGGALPIDMVVDGEGRNLFLLEATGELRASSIDGLTGLLTVGEALATNVANPRLLRLSDSGDAMAVLGDSLAIFAIDENGLLSPAAVLDGTQSWTDVRLQEDRGVGATQTGAVGFLWQVGAPLDLRLEIGLPGDRRGQIAYAQAGVFVVNGEDVSVTRLSQNQQGSLALIATFALPEELTDPQALTALFDGEDLLVGDSDSVVLLHPQEDGLAEEGHADLDQSPTVLFAVPESAFVLAGHADGEGYHLLEVGEEGLAVLGEYETEHAGVSAFGFAERFERITETVSL